MENLYSENPREDYTEENPKTGLSAFWLKIIAVTGMIMQHTALSMQGVFNFETEVILQIAGGFTMPIMTFLLVEGFRATSNVHKYMNRLAIFGLISIIPHLLGLGSGLNVMFSLLVSLYLLNHRKKHGNTARFWLVFITMCFAMSFYDWGFIGPITALVCYLIKNETAKRIVTPLVFVLGIFIHSAVLGSFFHILTGISIMDGGTGAGAFFPIGCLLVIPLLLLYKGKRGKPAKWFFYVIYPLHLMVLGIISLVIGTNVILSIIREITFYLG